MRFSSDRVYKRGTIYINGQLRCKIKYYWLIQIKIIADLTNQIAKIFCYYNTDDILSCLFCDLVLIQMRCNFSVRAYATELSLFVKRSTFLFACITNLLSGISGNTLYKYNYNLCAKCFDPEQIPRVFALFDTLSQQECWT